MGRLAIGCRREIKQRSPLRRRGGLATIRGHRARWFSTVEARVFVKGVHLVVSLPVPHRKVRSTHRDNSACEVTLWHCGSEELKEYDSRAADAEVCGRQGRGKGGEDGGRGEVQTGQLARIEVE